MAVGRKILAYRKRLRKGAVMKPKTFSRIEKGAMKRYGIGKARAAKIAGAAYWRALRAKYKRTH
jgi:hypothetical protein